MLRRLGIRGKVLAALAVPVLVLFGAASIISSQSIEASRVARAVNSLVSTADELGAFTQAVQVERQETLAFLADPAAPREALFAARAESDTRSAEYAVAVATIDVDVLDASVGEYLGLSAKSRGTLPTLPARWDVTAALLPAVVDAQYTAIVKLHVETARVLANALSDRALAQYLDAYGLLGESREQLVHELPAAVQVITSGGSDARQVVNLAPSIAVTTAVRAQARTAVNRLRLTDVQLTTQNAAYAGQRLLLASGSATAVSNVDLASFQAASTAEIDELAAIAEQVRVMSVDKASTNEAATIRTARLTIGATGLIVLLSIAIALLIAGQIVVPLRRLTKAVGDVREALPRLVEQVSVPGDAPQLSLVQIPVTSRDEVGRLARAFNDVNATTIQIAQEQAALRGSIAEMFVNVARRDQVLLNRQISFIDALERSEEDPNVLSNLFRLDHLATRMRRNAESLLVLAGIESGRRVRDAMPLSDVIRTASSEIEQYDRVQLELGVDPKMIGFSALAGAHLLAELLENATLFSEPGTPVEVATSIDGEFIQVVVHDLGLGMTDEEIEAAHLKIRSATAGDVLGAQRLGFYVVGRLASRLNADVVIAKSPNGIGTVVTVRFPDRLFEGTTVPGDDAVAPSTAQLGLSPALAEPALEPEPPVVVPVDLAALTDGETSLGLPRRRPRVDTGADAGAAVPEGAVGAVPDGSGVAVPDGAAALRPDQADLPDAVVPPESGVDRDERLFVLPPLEEARLTPELAVPEAGWAPEVSASRSTTSASLPNRANAPRTVVGEDLGLAPRSTTPRVSKPDRGTLFGGFRGRAADAPPSIDRPPLDRRTIPGAHDVSETEAAVEAAVDTAVEAPVLATAEPRFDFVIPQLEPDEEPWAPQLSLGAPLVARTDAVAPVSQVEVAAVEVAAVVPTAVVVPPVVTTPSSFMPPAATPPAPVAASGVNAPAVFEPILNEARAWGADDVSSWKPAAQIEPVPVAAPDAGPWIVPELQPAPVVDEQVQPEVAPEPTVLATRSVPAVASVPAVETLPVPSAVGYPPPPAAEVITPATPAKRGWFGRRRSAKPAVAVPWVPAEPLAAAEPVAILPARTSVLPKPLLPEPLAPAASAAAAPASAAVAGEVPAPTAPRSGRHSRQGAVESWPTLEENAASAALAALREEPQWVAPVVGESEAGSLVKRGGSRRPRTAAIAVVGAPEPDRAPVADPATVEPAEALPPKAAWAPTSFGEIIGSALDPQPQPQSPPSVGAVGPAEASPRTKRGWRGRKQQPAAVEASSAQPPRISAWDAPAVVPPLADTAPRWTPQRDQHEPVAYVPVDAIPSVPSSGWAAPVWAETAPDSASGADRAADPADNRGVPSPAPPPVIVHRPASSGVLDADVAAMLALRSDIQEQAFAELGQLAAYRPSAVGSNGGNSLTRRVPTAMPAQAPPIDEAGPTTRDPDQLRSRLSSFQSGTSRGRAAAEQPVEAPGDADASPATGTVITRPLAADASRATHEEEE